MTDKDIAKKLYSDYKHGGVPEDEFLSREYKIFIGKKTIANTLYEKLAQFSGKLLKLEVSPEEKTRVDEIFKSFDYAVTAEDAKAFSILTAIALFALGIIFIPFSLMFAVTFFVLAVFAFLYFTNYPKRIVEIRRGKASSEIILAVLYMVIYMKNVSNFEDAVKFAADNLKGPLGMDFKKMLWDVSAKKYVNAQEAFDKYLMMWKKYNTPFVDAVYLIETSLAQKDDARRVDLLDKALKRILEGTYEIMVHYVNALRTPISAIFMMGITLPIMGLVMLPIVGAFLANIITPASLVLFYDIILPLVVIILIMQVLATRPHPFSQTDLSGHPLVPPKGKFYIFGKAAPIIVPTIVSFVLLSIPFVYYIFNSSSTSMLPSENDVLFSLFFVLAISISIAIYAYLSSSIQVKIRKHIKGVEDDFAYALFQISNRIAEGAPAEIALIKTAAVMKKSNVYDFINIISNNMVKLGLSLGYAVFDKKYGAILFYPSSLIKSVMRVFLESIKKSQKIAAASLMHTAKYLQSVHKINEKIRDVLSETISSLKFQATFVAPLIAGIVVGLTSMIMIILSVLGEKLGSVSNISGTSTAGLSGAMTLGFFEMKNTIPLMDFQLIIGIYLIEIVIISAVLLSKIEVGDDKINELHSISMYLPVAIVIYFFVAFGVTVAFSSMAKIAIALGSFA